MTFDDSFSGIGIDFLPHEFIARIKNTIKLNIINLLKKFFIYFKNLLFAFLICFKTSFGEVPPYDIFDFTEFSTLNTLKTL